jgi:hypothetical protein
MTAASANAMDIARAIESRVIVTFLQKKSPATCRAPSVQKGRLLLLLGLPSALLAIALILLRGGLGLILRGGLGGFIGTLLLIGHSISFQKTQKLFSRYLR